MSVTNELGQAVIERVKEALLTLEMPSAPPVPPAPTPPPVIDPQDAGRLAGHFKVYYGYEQKLQNAATWPRVIVRPVNGRLGPNGKASTTFVDLVIGVKDRVYGFELLNIAKDRIIEAFYENPCLGKFIFNNEASWDNWNDQQIDTYQCIVQLGFDIPSPVEQASVLKNWL